MPKIITVTANTAIDSVIEVNQLSKQRNIVATSNIEFAAGKGINVAKAVESLGYSVHALGFVGKKSISLFNSLNSDKFTSDYTLVEGKTRSNITLFDIYDNQETHIRTSGFKVNLDDCSCLIEQFEKCIEKDDIAIFSGSLPLGSINELYQILIESCHQKGAIPFLDSSGESFQQALIAKPYLVKPNQRELEDIVGLALLNEQDIIDAAKVILSHGIQWVIVSRANKGLIAVSEDSTFAASTKNFEKIMTSVGCGDALVAGLAVGFVNNYSATEMIKLGITCGAANLFSLEPGRFDKNLLKRIEPHVFLNKL